MARTEREASRQRIFIVLAVFGAIILLTNLALVTGTDFGFKIQKLQVPEVLKDIHLEDINFDASHEIVDNHPIVSLMEAAGRRFRTYKSSSSKTFAQAVKTYRAKYGRHPPPNFDKWYEFARDRGIHHLDDFDQIHDDLRPFWSISPAELRRLVHGMLAEESGSSGITGIVIKDGKPEVTTNKDNQRAQTFAAMLEVFAKDLPDMEIAVNSLDQPRVVVDWETLQAHLKKEERGRIMPPEVTNEFTARKPFGNLTSFSTAGWFKTSGKLYTNLTLACPPDSPARNNLISPEAAEERYKLPHSGGLVNNFNTSSDLCTVGPAISDLHGFMFSTWPVMTTKLIPVFSESKVNVNNDILFPASTYYKPPSAYEYTPSNDITWEDKAATLFWRSTTPGGVQTQKNWQNLHPHRLVLITNATTLAATDHTEKILNWYNGAEKNYLENPNFHPSTFAHEHTDVGFSALTGCVPDDDCAWLKEFFTTVNQSTLTDQLRYRFLVDIDGTGAPSGRWNTFLKSRSMGIKATVFREWHDSRLFEWLHFAPMDNRFDDLYTLLTYFIGLGSSGSGVGPRTDFYVPAHDFEAKRIADTGRDWAGRVLRREDMEVYGFRLMLEYGRLLDDARDRIGYGGDGKEVEEKWG